MPDTESFTLPRPHTRIGVGGVLIREGRVLVNRAVYRTLFTIPSGFVEAGEALEPALIREFREETGVSPVVGRLLLARHKVLEAGVSDVYFAFQVGLIRGEPSAILPEIAESREILASEAIDRPWISELSRMAIRAGMRQDAGWARSTWTGGSAPGVATELYLSEHE